MKKLLLLPLFAMVFFSYANAQKTQKPVTAFAITGTEKGNLNWSEVRLIDINTGQEVQTVYQTSQEMQLLNARTKKPIAVTDESNDETKLSTLKYKTGAYTLQKVNGKAELTPVAPGDAQNKLSNNQVYIRVTQPAKDKPFSTMSAACAYDERHERLYYTPMGINELRYIDLKSKTPSIKYFEGEAFGALANRRDVPNHITRMVIASDGNGYALTNNGEHLIRFTTNRKATITDLGSLTDDAANGKNSIHSTSSYGGDMIADDQKNLYVITAYRKVFKISPETMVATYVGNIQGLPKGYTTNGAAVEEGTSVIVTSSQSTAGYFRFDINTLQAEAIPNSGTVFNASDLANANLLSDKKDGGSTKEAFVPLVSRNTEEIRKMNQVSVYPNPVVTGGNVKITFTNQKEGRYTIQLVDMAGKLVSASQVTINNKMQVEPYALPELSAKGNYLIKVVNGNDKIISINKIVVQ